MKPTLLERYQQMSTAELVHHVKTITIPQGRENLELITVLTNRLEAVDSVEDKQMKTMRKVEVHIAPDCTEITESGIGIERVLPTDITFEFWDKGGTYRISKSLDDLTCEDLYELQGESGRLGGG